MPPLFTMGPDQHPDDLRLTRPYFVVPLDVPTALDDVRDRIRKWAVHSAKEPTSLLLRLADVPHPENLAAKLNDANDPVAVHLKRQFSCDTQRLLDLIGEGYASSSLPTTLIDELNVLCKGVCLYNPKHFPATRLPTLSPSLNAEIEQKLAANAAGPELLKLNRWILEEAYPEDVLRSPPKGKVTDIVVLSHGWHRNFFSAVEAYDKLMSGLAVLMHRERLNRPEPYHPLFITLHWHSDPGENGWEDKRGRRLLASFLENVEKTFARPSAEAERRLRVEERFTNVFEDIFQLFSRMSAPGTDALGDPELQKQGVQLAGKLRNFYLRDAASAEFADKATAAWSCYDRASPQGVLLDQHDSPGKFITLGKAVYNLWCFLFKAAGLVVVLGLLLNLLGWAGPVIQEYWPLLVIPWAEAIPLALVSGLVLIPLAILGSVAIYNPHKRYLPGHGLSVLFVAAWACLEAVCALPLAIYLLISYFLAGRVGTAAFLFDERLGTRDSPAALGQRKVPRWRFIRYWLATLARLPVMLLRRSLSKDSRANAFVDELDGELAFWEMQIRGVETGARAADFLAGLFQTLDLQDVRIHLVGHSFGGLVVANAARHLALEGAHQQALKDVHSKAPDGRQYAGKIHTLCLIQGALGSAWFDQEQQLLDLLNGSLACIYSRYDTANGFYYPVSNHGRLAAGYVGLNKAGKDHEPRTLPQPGSASDRGLFASLTEPPELNDFLGQRFSEHKGRWVLNLDASRLIYEGSILTGGGHGDIFKSDVIHLIWAITRLRGGQVAAGPPAAVATPASSRSVSVTPHGSPAGP